MGTISTTFSESSIHYCRGQRLHVMKHNIIHDQYCPPLIITYCFHFFNGTHTLSLNSEVGLPWHVCIMDVRDSLIFRLLISPNGFYSERFYFEKSFLRTVFSPLFRKAYNPKGHCSENFNSEMPLFRMVFATKGFYSERFLIRTVFDQSGFNSERLFPRNSE